ncbi:MAG: cell division topological specificity factor MinE [Cyanobacteria bacterium P01_D01_bin.105]
MAIPIISDLIERLFGPAEDPHSRDDVKRRLQIVLAHDRLALDPQALEMMRQEIIAVVSRYVEVDFESLEFSLATNERVTALTANLPIRRIRPLGRGADQPIKADDEVERIELASPAEAVALDAKETEAALRKFEADNSDTHLHLDIDRKEPNALELEASDEKSERSVIEEAEESPEVLEEPGEQSATKREDAKLLDAGVESAQLGASSADKVLSEFQPPDKNN